MNADFRSWISVHFEQALGFVGGFSYAFVNIHLSLQVREYVVKIIAALFVGFMTAVGGWLFRVLVKALTPKHKSQLNYQSDEKHKRTLFEGETKNKKS